MYLCPECDGWGEVKWDGDYSSHTYSDDCRFCDGEGKVSEKKRRLVGRTEVTGEDCSECDGKGEVFDDLERVKVCGVDIGACYYRKIRALGDGVCKVHGQLFLFQCGDVQGLLMTLSPEV